MRPFFHKDNLWSYPLYAAAGGAFGYWLTGVEGRQMKMLGDRRDRLLEKRRRRADREGDVSAGQDSQSGKGDTLKHTAGITV